jgi:hypothetical protein
MTVSAAAISAPSATEACALTPAMAKPAARPSSSMLDKTLVRLIRTLVGSLLRRLGLVVIAQDSGTGELGRIGALGSRECRG